MPRTFKSLAHCDAHHPLEERDDHVLEFTFTAHGVTRPECIAEAADGSIWVTDKASAAAQLRGDGSIRPLGHAGGEPNSINFMPDGRLLIANFEGHLQTLDTATGAVESLVTEVDGVPITHANYALANAAGYVWATESTRYPNPGPAATSQMLQNLDGWLFVRRKLGDPCRRTGLRQRSGALRRRPLSVSGGDLRRSAQPRRDQTGRRGR